MNISKKKIINDLNEFLQFQNIFFLLLIFRQVNLWKNKIVYSATFLIAKL